MPPLGWFLGQGLYPLGPDSSDDEEGPCELPSGRLVCGPHGLVVCGKCYTDYSFTNEGLSDNEDEDEDEDEYDDEDEDGMGLDTDKKWHGLERRKGTGKVFPTRFYPPYNSITPGVPFWPHLLFSGRRRVMDAIRYTHRDDPDTLLLFTDGACLNNGQPNPKAGWAFVHDAGPGIDNPEGAVAGRLEAQGPFGDAAIQSSNRAELRAVIAALRFRPWAGEGFHTAVIATDSEYVVEGSTTWAKNWIKNGWTTSGGRQPVKNRDLWEMLLGEVERHKEAGLAIQFWGIRRELNTVADAAAKKAAERDLVDLEWDDVIVSPKYFGSRTG